MNNKMDLVLSDIRPSLAYAAIPLHFISWSYLVLTGSFGIGAIAAIVLALFIYLLFRPYKEKQNP